jgi:cytochrome o ubiquinol oxidase operon protein cyoD
MNEHNQHNLEHQEEEGPHSTFSGYMIGFIASVILTAIPFWLVMADVFSSRNMTIVIRFSANCSAYDLFFAHEFSL